MSVADGIARAVFGHLFEGSDAAFIVDATGRVVSANRCATEMLELEPEELLGAELHSLIHEPERDLSLPGHYEEVELRRGDGYPIFVELQVATVRTEALGWVRAYVARDTSERRALERELQAKHSALFTAHAELERAHGQLALAKRELETRNHEIALLAWRAAMGELVAGIAHHLNNPVGALSSSLRRLDGLTRKLPDEHRPEHERVLARIHQLARRIETNVAAIVKASQANAAPELGTRPDLPPELSTVLATFVERLDDIPTTTKESP